MKPSTKRLLSMILSFLLLVAAFVIYYNFLVPAYGDLENLKGQAAAKDNFIKTQQNAINQIKSLINAYNSSADVQNTVSTALPDSPQLSSALAQISGLAANDGLGIFSLNASVQPLQNVAGGNVSPGPASPQSLIKSLGTITLQVGIAGSYENLSKFVNDLEDDIRILDVKELRINSVPENAKRDFYNYTLTVATYYQSE